jgi:hypothetical protein
MGTLKRTKDSSPLVDQALLWNPSQRKVKQDRILHNNKIKHIQFGKVSKSHSIYYLRLNPQTTPEDSYSCLNFKVNTFVKLSQKAMKSFNMPILACQFKLVSKQLAIHIRIITSSYVLYNKNCKLQTRTMFSVLLVNQN